MNNEIKFHPGFPEESQEADTLNSRSDKRATSVGKYQKHRNNSAALSKWRNRSTAKSQVMRVSLKRALSKAYVKTYRNLQAWKALFINN
jgi:hypothetical protein